MKFDWYAATVPEVPLPVVIHSLQRHYGIAPEEGRRRLGYSQSFRFVRSNELLAEVLAGPVNGRLSPHAVATGARAEDLSNVLRGDFPGHKVTRLDACEDYDEPGAFERLTEQMKSVRERKGIKGQWIKPDDPMDGATYYLGSTASPVRVRCYQKGLQLRKTLHPGLHETVSADWARLEVQVRPERGGKELAAQCTPEQVWGFSEWSQQLAAETMGLDVAKIKGVLRGIAPDDISFDWMLRHYGGLLERMHADAGDWACVGLQIGHRLGELKKATT